METHTENIDSFSRIKSSNTKMCEILRENLNYVHIQSAYSWTIYAPTKNKFKHRQFKIWRHSFRSKISVCSDISQYFNLIIVALWRSPYERVCKWCVHVADIWEVYLKVSPAIMLVPIFEHSPFNKFLTFTTAPMRLPIKGQPEHFSQVFFVVSLIIYSKQTSERDQVRRAV